MSPEVQRQLLDLVEEQKKEAEKKEREKMEQQKSPEPESADPYGEHPKPVSCLFYQLFNI